MSDMVGKMPNIWRGSEGGLGPRYYKLCRLATRNIQYRTVHAYAVETVPTTGEQPMDACGYRSTKIIWIGEIFYSTIKLVVIDISWDFATSCF